MASKFSSITAKNPAEIKLEDILQEIKTKQPVTSKADKLKLETYSPYPMTDSTDEGVSSHTGVFIFDIDSLSNAAISSRDQIKTWLSRDEFVCFVYKTMTGLHFGIKAATIPELSPELHTQFYTAICEYYQAAYEAEGFTQKVKWDPSASNIGRRWFIHGDPTIWIRKQPSTFLGHGNRNSQLTSLFGRYASYRQDAATIIHKMNAALANPLSNHELETIIGSVEKMTTSAPSKTVRLHQQIDAIRNWLGTDLKYDVYKDALIHKNQLITDEQVTTLRTELERETRITIPRTDFRDFINTVGLEHQYDWFREWLNEDEPTFPWDNTDIGHRLIVCRLCKTGCDSCIEGRILDNDYAEWAGRWLRLIVDGFVGRNIEPGARFPYVPYVLGSQGIAKSDMLKILASGLLTEENYALVPDIEFYKGDIETVYASQGVLIFEDGEAMVSARVQHSAQKRFATETVDRGLKKWRVIKSEKPRRYIVVVTSNERQHFPKGETRRFPVLDLPVNSRIDTDWLLKVRDDLLRTRFHTLKHILPGNPNALILENKWRSVVEKANLEYKWVDETDDFAEDIKKLLEHDNIAYGVRSSVIAQAFNKKVRELRPALEYAGLVNKPVYLVTGDISRLWVLKDSSGPYTARDLSEIQGWD